MKAERVVDTPSKSLRMLEVKTLVYTLTDMQRDVGDVLQ